MFTLKLDQHHFTSLRGKTSTRWRGLSPRLSILDTDAPTKCSARRRLLTPNSPTPPWTRAIARNSQQKPIRNPGFSAHSHTHAQRTFPRCISPACINKRITPPCLALVRGAFSSLSVTPDTQPRCSLTPAVSPDSLVSDKARSLGTYRPFLIPH